MFQFLHHCWGQVIGFAELLCKSTTWIIFGSSTTSFSSVICVWHHPLIQNCLSVKQKVQILQQNYKYEWAVCSSENLSKNFYCAVISSNLLQYIKGRLWGLLYLSVFIVFCYWMNADYFFLQGLSVAEVTEGFEMACKKVLDILPGIFLEFTMFSFNNLFTCILLVNKLQLLNSQKLIRYGGSIQHWFHFSAETLKSAVLEDPLKSNQGRNVSVIVNFWTVRNYPQIQKAISFVHVFFHYFQSCLLVK